MDGRTAAATLGVGPLATRDEIRLAFRARAKVLHPDAGPAGSTERFIALGQAVERLMAAAPTTAPAPAETLHGGSPRFDTAAVRPSRSGAAIDLTDTVRRPPTDGGAGHRRRADRPVARDASGLSFEDHLAAALSRT